MPADTASRTTPTARQRAGHVVPERERVHGARGEQRDRAAHHEQRQQHDQHRWVGLAEGAHGPEAVPVERLDVVDEDRRDARPEEHADDGTREHQPDRVIEPLPSARQDVHQDRRERRAGDGEPDEGRRVAGAEGDDSTTANEARLR